MMTKIWTRVKSVMVYRSDIDGCTGQAQWAEGGEDPVDKPLQGRACTPYSGFCQPWGGWAGCLIISNKYDCISFSTQIQIWWQRQMWCYIIPKVVVLVGTFLTCVQASALFTAVHEGSNFKLRRLSFKMGLSHILNYPISNVPLSQHFAKSHLPLKLMKCVKGPPKRGLCTNIFPEALCSPNRDPKQVARASVI